MLKREQADKRGMRELIARSSVRMWCTLLGCWGTCCIVHEKNRENYNGNVRFTVRVGKNREYGFFTNNRLSIQGLKAGVVLFSLRFHHLLCGFWKVFDEAS